MSDKKNDPSPLSREAKLRRDLTAGEAVVTNTMYGVQKSMAEGKDDAAAPTNKAFRRPAETAELPNVAEITNAHNVRGRSAEEDAADPELDFAESPVTMQFLSSEERAAITDDFVEDWAPQETREVILPEASEGRKAWLRIVPAIQAITDPVEGGAEAGSQSDEYLPGPRSSEMYGQGQIQIDQDAQKILLQLAAEHLPHVRAVGEESEDCEWDGLEDLEEGDLAAVFDPIDGSAPFVVTGQNFSIVVMIGEERNGHIEIVGVIMASPDHTVLTVNLLEGTVTYKAFVVEVQVNPATNQIVPEVTTVTRVLDPQRPLPYSDPHVITTVALSASGREKVSEIFKTTGPVYLPPVKKGGKFVNLTGFSVNPFGGNPALHQMASRGGVRFFLQSDWSTCFDAAGILALAVQKGRYEYWRLDDTNKGPQKITEDKVIALFHDIHRPNKTGSKAAGPGTYRPIPPMFIRERGGGYGGDAVYVPAGSPGPVPGWTITDYILDRIMRNRRGEYVIKSEPKGRS